MKTLLAATLLLATLLMSPVYSYGNYGYGGYARRIGYVRTYNTGYRPYYMFSNDRRHYRKVYVNYHGNFYFGPIKRITNHAGF